LKHFRAIEFRVGFRLVLLLGFGFVSLFSLFVAVRFLLSYLFALSPSKISGDWQLTSIFVLLWLFESIVFASLFYALFCRKPYFAHFYWFALVTGIVIQIMLKMTPFTNPRYFYSDLLFVAIADGLPIALGIYFFVQRKQFPQDSAKRR